MTELTSAVKANILRQVAAEQHPKIALPNIAHRLEITLAELQAMLNKHGYPRPESMLRAAAILENPASAATPDAPSSETTPDLLNPRVPISSIHPDPQNLREDVGDVSELAQSMAEAGMLQPVLARKNNGRLIVVAGHRRLAAAKSLGWTHVPVLVRRDMRPDQVLAAMLIENGQRRDLDPIEVARGLRALKEQTKASHAVVARRIGRSQAFVSERLALLNLSTEDQRLVREGRFKLSQAIARGRENGGRVRPGARTGRAPGHFSQSHMLASQVRLRCSSLDHSTANSMSVGGSGCGECWEAVIRADERDHFHATAAQTGQCPICDAPVSQEISA